MAETFYSTSEIYEKCHFTDKLLNNNFILGRDVLQELGIIFRFQNKIITPPEVSTQIVQETNPL